MYLEDFEPGKLVQQLASYKAFIPNEINQGYLWRTPEMNILLEKATLHLGELNSFSRFVPDIDLFLRMHIVKEATLSSRIEGTRTEIEDALVKESEVTPEKRNDWQEVSNYIGAMNYAIQRLESLPISSRLLKETHKILLNNNIRGEHKLPGEFRTSQNWIGGASISDAVFVPPPFHEVERLMGDLEKFIHNDAIAVPHLIKIALVHYQFETIHPFLDGNGRIGRLLIPLYLLSNKMIEKPIFYLSAFFEKNKGLYYDNLMNIRRNHDLIQWVKFFLVGVSQTCEVAAKSLQEIMRLRQEIEGGKIIGLGRKAPAAKKFLDHLFTEPIVTAQEAAAVLGMSQVSTYKIIEDFVRIGVLKEITGFKRNRYFMFDQDLTIFR
jgi:Fic family protein